MMREGVLVRKSVTIGFGLWLFAIVTVAAVASFTIQTAGRQITSVEITDDLPEITAALGPDPTPAPDHANLGGAVLVDASAIRGAANVPARPQNRADRSTLRAVFRSYGTSGGRLRVRCAGAVMSLDGGFARPESGWSARVDVPRTTMLVAVFWNQTHTITVAAQCSGGRPVFTEQVFPLRHGAPPPAQVGQGLLSPPPAPAPTSPPGSGPFPGPGPYQGFGPGPGPSSESVPSGPGPATRSVESVSVDPAQITAYVQVQDDQCGRAQWNTEWCHRWGALSDEQQFLMVWQWLLTVLNPSSSSSTSADSSPAVAVTPVAPGNVPQAT
jgi:hypothetical protein